MTAPRFRILALDVDGTLLGPDGTLRPRTRDAVARAAAAGIRPVLCTGRRYRRARPIARQLGLDAPLVCNSGAIIKDPATHRTLWRADLDPDVADSVIGLFRDHDQPAVVFTDRPDDRADFIIRAYPTGRKAFDDYIRQNHEHAEINAGWRWHGWLNQETASKPEHDPLFHVCAIGTLAQMLAFQETALYRLGGRVQTFVQRSQRYLGTMCEILRRTPANGRPCGNSPTRGASSPRPSVPWATRSTTSRCSRTPAWASPWATPGPKSRPQPTS